MFLHESARGLRCCRALSPGSRAQGFDAEAPVSTSETLAKALKKGADIVAKGGRYFIDSVIEPGYAENVPDQRAGMVKKD